MLSYLSSFFSSSQSTSQPTSSSEPASTSETQSSFDQTSPTNPAHTERNRKKRLAKKKSKQKRRQSTLPQGGGEGSDDDEDEGGGRGPEQDEEFPDADDDLSYIPLEPDNTPLKSTLPPPPSSRPPKSSGAQPSSIPPQEVLSAVSRLPPLLPNGERLPNDERAKRIIRSQGFVPVEDEDGGLHVGVKVRDGVVAVMGKDGPLLFNM